MTSTSSRPLFSLLALFFLMIPGVITDGINSWDNQKDSYFDYDDKLVLNRSKSKLLISKHLVVPLFKSVPYLKGRQ